MLDKQITEQRKKMELEAAGLADSLEDALQRIDVRPIEVPIEWRVPPLPRPGPVDVTPMAHGGAGVATQPTLFLAGEAGPEPYAFGSAASPQGPAASETEPEWARRLTEEIRQLPRAIRTGIRDGIIQAGV